MNASPLRVFNVYRNLSFFRLSGNRKSFFPKHKAARFSIIFLVLSIVISGCANQEHHRWKVMSPGENLVFELRSSSETLDSPQKEFLHGLPAAWDDTKFLDGHPGEYIALARRKGDTWYIAGINSKKDRKLTLDLSFMEKRIPELTVYMDDEQGKIVKDVIAIQDGTKFNIEMKRYGGFAAKL